MRRWAICAALLLAAPASPGLAEPVGQPPIAATGTSIAAAYPQARVAFADGVTGLPALTYAQPPGYRPLTLDLYLPPAGAQGQPPPLVVFVHGGGWTVGDPRSNGRSADFPAVLASVAARGYAVASISYRLSAEARFPAPLVDVKTAIRWLRAQAPIYDYDPAQVFLWGASSGGHLAALAATTCDADPKLAPPMSGFPVPPLPPGSDCVRGAVIWYGVADFTRYINHVTPEGSKTAGLKPLFFGCTDACVEPLRAASPIAQLDPRDPPMLLIHGTADTAVPPEQSVLMAQEMKAVGVPVELDLIPGVNHGFVGPDAATTAAATRHALDRTLGFFDRLRQH